jgi:hypothetical protein
MIAQSVPQRQPSAANTPVYLPGSSKIIGYVSGLVFAKTISGSKHFLRRPAAIAFDVATLDAAEAAGAVMVKVTDGETGHVYAQRIVTIRAYGFPVTRGFGRQIALPLNAYAIDGKPPTHPPGALTNNQERKDLQPSLFGGES